MGETDEKFDDLLSLLKTGKWNLFIIFVVSLYYMQASIFVMSGAFIVPYIPHTCNASPAQQYPDATTIATEPVDTISLANDTLDNDEWSCSLPGDASRPCTSWTFNTSVYGSTLTSEFELVCDRTYFRGLYNSLFFFGGVAGSPVSGWMSDRFGRKRMFFVAVFIVVIISIVIPLLPYLQALLALRFIHGIIHPFTIEPSFTLVMEVFEKPKRSAAGLVVFVTWPFGMMVMAWISSVVMDWRWRNFCYALLPVLLLPLIWILDESPRWLIVSGRHTDAHKVLERVARWNNSSLPPAKDLQALMKSIQEKSSDSSSTKQEGRLRRLRKFMVAVTLLFRTRRLRKITLILFGISFTTALSYTGLSLSGDFFSSDPFVYMAMAGLVEIPGYTLTIPIVERFGRLRSNVVFYFLTGACLISLAVTPISLGWLVTTLALLGKMTLSAAYEILFLQEGELFPTEVRTWGMSNAAMMSRLGSVLGSFFVSTIPTSWTAAPSIVFGCSCLLASGATLLLPETRGAPLYDTVAAFEAA